MKALATAENRFAGCHLVKALLQRGDQGVVLVRQTSDLSQMADCTGNIYEGCSLPSGWLQSLGSGLR